MDLNERTDLSTLAINLKKKVSNLLWVYTLLIILTILLFFAITAAVIFLEWIMLSDGRINMRLVVLGGAVIVAAAIALGAVLKPLFGLFKVPEKKGIKIKRKDYPELFSIIDEIVKEVDCLEPRNVYISNECNAYVYNPSFLGYLKKNGRQNLTIGLPLLYSMNVTEMKSILAHEFGHFTQQSVQMNRIANLSEFICGSIIRSQQEMAEATEADSQSLKRYAIGYVRRIGNVMLKQYHKVAPINGILSRAQEYDADHYSQLVVGTDGSISALSKLSYLSPRWANYYNILLGFADKDKRGPENYLDSFNACMKTMDSMSLSLSSNDHLKKPRVEFPSRIGSADNTDTHPSTEERVLALLSHPHKDTAWDNRPAWDLFSDKTVREVFSTIRKQVEDELYRDYTAIPVSYDLTLAEIAQRFKDANPPLFNPFYDDVLFFTKDSFPDEDASDAYKSNPFTHDNSLIMAEYHTAQEDYNTLLAIQEEHSAETVFLYNGNRYDGTCTPIELHKAYYEPLLAKATEIAKHCNWWLEERSETKGKTDVYFLFRISWMVDRKLMSLLEPIKQVSYLIQNNVTTPDAIQYINDGISEVHQIVAPLFTKRDNGRIDLDLLYDYTQLPEEEKNKAVDFYINEHPDGRVLIDGFISIGKASYAAKIMAWRELVHEVILNDYIESSTRF